MKLFKFFGVVSAALAQSDDQISSDENPLTDLATEFEGFKFMIDDILRSREEESKHLTARIIELEDKLAQQQILFYQAKLKQSGITEKVVKEASAKQEKEDKNDFGPNYQGILDFFNEGF